MPRTSLREEMQTTVGQLEDQVAAGVQKKQATAYRASLGDVDCRQSDEEQTAVDVHKKEVTTPHMYSRGGRWGVPAIKIKPRNPGQPQRRTIVLSTFPCRALGWSPTMMTRPGDHIQLLRDAAAAPLVSMRGLGGDQQP